MQCHRKVALELKFLGLYTFRCTFTVGQRCHWAVGSMAVPQTQGWGWSLRWGSSMRGRAVQLDSLGAKILAKIACQDYAPVWSMGLGAGLRKEPPPPCVLLPDPSYPLPPRA